MKTIYKSALVFVFLTTFHSFVISQTPWQRAIGGASTDGAYSIIQTADGGYAAAGYTTSFGVGGYDFYIVKLNSSAELQWTRSAGGGGDEYAYSIIQTADGGYAVAGYTRSFGAGLADIYIIKLDPAGKLQWSRTAGGTGNDYGHSIIQTADGGYAAAGYTHSFGAGGGDFYIVKLDAGGALQWSKTIGGIYWDIAYKIFQTADGGYVISGWAVSFEFGLYIVKLNANGTLQWNTCIDGLGYPTIVSAIQTADGGYAMVGHTEGKDVHIVKLDSSGTLQWSKIIGGKSFDYGMTIIQTSDEGYTAAGYTSSFGAGANDFYIVKLDSGGTLLGSVTVGGIKTDIAFSITKTADGGFVAAGETSSFSTGQSDIYIVKFDSNWATCSNFSSPSSNSEPGLSQVFASPTIKMQASKVISPATLTGTGGTLSHVCFVGIQTASNEMPKEFALSQNYPNPFNPTTHFEFRISNFGLAKLQIFDALGREIAVLVNEELPPGTYEMDWNASNYPSGVYFYTLSAGSFKETRRMVLVK